MKTKFHLYLSIFAIFAFLVIPKSTFAASTSPFIGHWQAIDVDGSDIRLSIAGPPQGPFQITWTESYISFCDREAGIVRGTGWLNEGDSNLLEADLHLECFTTGASLDFQIAWVYDPGTDTISDGSLTWHRPGQRGGKCLPPPAGLTGWWPGDGDANDIVSGRNGIFVGDATTRSGLVDLAFSLDGDGDFIDVPDSPGLNFGPGNFTVDLWVNFNDTSGEQVLAEKWVQGDEYVDGWTLTKLESGELRFALDSGEGNEVALDTEGLTLLPHIWYHFAATRQGSEITLYKNGGIVARNPEIGSSNLNSPSSLKFGHRGNSEDTPGSIDDRGLYLKGRIDEVELLVGTALSENQILAIYQAGSDGKCKDEVQPPPPLDLRVNYGDDDWVESFYEAGHTVWITVTEDDGATVRATAKLVTQPRDEWGGEEGFQTSPEDWVPSQPEIQPNDWVFGWVDNGASAQVQIGDISGIINLTADSIEGTIYAPWFSDEVEVECHSWGAPFPDEILKYDMALPNGEDTYACSWAGEWNILPGQVVGVGYFGPDGHWVANTFYTFVPQIVASESGDWFWTTGFIPGSLNLFIFESADEDAPLLWQGTRVADEGGFVSVGYEDHGQDLVPGNVLVISDEMNQKELVLEPIAVDVFDAENEIMAGTAPPGSEVWAAAGPMEWQERIFVEADPESGEWLADFKTIGFDITEEMRASSYAHIYDGDGDANEGSIPPPSPNPHFYVFPEWDYIIGWEWPAGTLVTAEVYHPDGDETPDCVATAEMTHPEWSDEEYVAEFFLSETCDIQAGDFVLLTDGLMGREHIVFPLQVTTLDPDMDTIGGVAEPGIEVNAWVHGEDSTFQTVLPNKHGNWMINFSPFNLEPGMGGRAEQYDEDGDATSVDWWIPNPRFTVFPEWEWFDGYDWPDGALVNISVESKAECDTAGVSSENFFNGGFPEGCDIAVGDVVTFTDGVTIRTHTIQNLTITVVDKEANTVAGTADAGALVYAWVHEYGYEMQLQVEDGTWLADFGSAGLDLVENMGGRAEIRDEFGNATAVDWNIPNPHFTVFPEWEWFDGLDWPDGITVTITVEGKSECGVAIESWGGFFNGGFGEGCDLTVGDTVTFSDGVTTRMHTVRNMAITAVDVDADTVSGTADPYETVYVWQHEAGEQIPVEADESGVWFADLSGYYDIRPGVGGRAEIRDEFSNGTAVDWYIPNPRLFAFPSADQIFGYEWPEGSEVSLTINGEYITTANVQGAPWDPNDIMAFFDFGEQFNLAAGDEVELSGSGMELAYTVQNLSVTEVNADANTVAGTADDGALVYAGVHEWWDVTEMQLIAENGTWLADFGSLGFDLAGGMCGRAEIRDDFGNATAVDWCVP